MARVEYNHDTGVAIVFVVPEMCDVPSMKGIEVFRMSALDIQLCRGMSPLIMASGDHAASRMLFNMLACIAPYTGVRVYAPANTRVRDGSWCAEFNNVVKTFYVGVKFDQDAASFKRRLRSLIYAAEPLREVFFTGSKAALYATSTGLTLRLSNMTHPTLRGLELLRLSPDGTLTLFDDERFALHNIQRNSRDAGHIVRDTLLSLRVGYTLEGGNAGGRWQLSRKGRLTAVTKGTTIADHGTSFGLLAKRLKGLYTLLPALTIIQPVQPTLPAKWAPTTPVAVTEATEATEVTEATEATEATEVTEVTEVAEAAKTTAERARVNALRMLRSTMRQHEWQAVIDSVTKVHPVYQLMREHMGARTG